MSLTLSPTLKRNGFLTFLVFFSGYTLFGQYIFHHKLVSLPLVTLSEASLVLYGITYYNCLQIFVDLLRCCTTVCGLPIYRLKDIHDDDIWQIEKILKTKGTGNNKHYFIKWLHWPKKFNSWISARDVNNLWFYYQWEWTIPERLTSSIGNLRPCTKDSIPLALSWGWRYYRVVDDSRIF